LPPQPRELPIRLSLSGPRAPPRLQIDGTHRHTENIGGHKSDLLSANSNDADDDAVQGRQRPAFPAATPHKNRGRDRQNTGQIIEPEHKQNLRNMIVKAMGIFRGDSLHWEVTEVTALVLLKPCFPSLVRVV
jgi:hypothetical protein